MSGRIVTCYSYKGGTGRSMAAANVAWILASCGHRVLLVDWDLEAPGLVGYLHPFLDSEELAEAEGVIDYVIDCVADSADLRVTKAEAADVVRGRINLLHYVVPLDHKFKGRGELHFLPSGRPGASYAARVNTFNWGEFYTERSGRHYINAAREQMRKEYDWVIVDSRTGVSDTAGICTVHLPDTLAVFFTLNNQSIDGSSKAAVSVLEQWRNRGYHFGKDGKRILPFITRVDDTEYDRLDISREMAQAAFASVLEIQDEIDPDMYWTQAETPYVPYYAYEEVLAVFRDRPGERGTVLASCEFVAQQVTQNFDIRLRRETVDRTVEILDAFRRKPAGFKGPKILISYRRADAQDASKVIYEQLIAHFGKESVFFDFYDIPFGVDIRSYVENVVSQCSAVLVVIGNKWLGGKKGDGSRMIDDPADIVRIEIRAALGRAIPLIPILIDSASMPTAHVLPDDIVGLTYLNAAQVESGKAMQDQLERLIDGIKAKLAAPKTVVYRIFVSSPDDVTEERHIAEQAIREVAIGRRFRGRVQLQTVAWDAPGIRVAMDARITPQEAISLGRPQPKECDLFVMILWSRMGTPLPQEYRKPSGEPYLSGTDWEFHNALEGFRENGKPRIWIYHRNERLELTSSEPHFEEKREQFQKVATFLDGFVGQDGSLLGGVNTYASPEEFRRVFKLHLRDKGLAY